MPQMKNPNIQASLNEEALSRNALSSFGTLLLLTITLTSDFSILNHSKWALFGSLLILATNLARLTWPRTKYKPSFEKYFGWPIAFSAIGWSILFIATIHERGIIHPQSFVILTVLSGISSSAAASLASQPNLVKIYLFFSLVIPGAFLLTLESVGISLSLVVFAFYAFLIQHSKIGYTNLVTIYVQQESLIANQKFIQNILNSIPGYVSVISIDDLRYKFTNQKLENYLKKTQGQIVGQIVGFSNNSPFVTEIKNYLKDTAQEPKYVRMQDSLSHRWNMLNISKIESSNDLLCISLDITNEVLLEQKNAEQRSLLLTSAKMADLGEIAAGVAHEINNPLAIIQGRISLLKRNNYKNPEDHTTIVENLEKMENAVDRAARIIKNLTTFSRNAEEDPFTQSPLLKIVEDTLSLLNEKIIKNNIQIKISIPEDVELLCRPTQISQALYNLITNASEAILQSPQPWIGIHCEKKNDHYYSISVTDSGKGIPPEVATKIFTPFYTTKLASKSVGMGLSIAYNIISEHQGTIYVDQSSENTKFVIELPVPKTALAAA